MTGGPAFGADIANAMSNANITLLVVTASVVAVLLIVTYRSPILWLVPLAVIGFADGLSTAVGYGRFALHGFDVRRCHRRNHQRACLRCGHELRAAADIALSRGTSGDRRSPPRLANCGEPRRARHRREQRDRGAGSADPCFRRRPGHPQPRRARRVRTSGRGAARPAGAAAVAEPIWQAAVLAVHSPPRQRAHGGHDRCVARHRRVGYRPRRPRRRHFRGGVGADGPRAARHADRVVADRTVPGEGRVGNRL